MDFTSIEFNRFRNEIKKAVAKVEEDFGVTIDFTKIKYDLTVGSFTINTEVFNGSRIDVQKKEFDRYCSSYGLNQEDYGKSFEYKGENLKLIGIDINKRKYPLMFEDRKGKVVLFTTEVIKRIK